jgi:hypothetical protein
MLDNYLDNYNNSKRRFSDGNSFFESLIQKISKLFHK